MMGKRPAMVLLVFVATVTSCQGDGPTTTATTASPPPAVTPGPSDIPRIEGAGMVVVPEGVRGKWIAVRLVVEDKVAMTTTEYVVPLKSQWKIPDTAFVVDVGEFLPDFTIQGSVFTSVTPDPANPAVKVKIVEDGTPLFDAWLFALYPSVHPFTHPRYGLILKEGIATS